MGDVSGIIIDCGGPGDAGFIGGNVVDRGPIEIAGTDRPNLFRRERWGLTGYTIPVAPGTYDVHLGFSETYSGVSAAGRRAFDVSVNGEPERRVDPYAAAGGRNRVSYVRFHGVDASGGEIDIRFGKVSGDPCINSIEVTLPGVYCDAPAAAEPKPDEPEPPKPDEPKVEPRPGNVEPPPHARRAGLTSLLFHEDFLDSSRISRTTSLRPGQTFCCLGPGNPTWGASILPANAIRHEDGEMTLAPNNNNYQGDIISSASLNSGFHLRGNRWCVEIRWKHPRKSASKGFPAFWSMDARHWYGRPVPGQGGEYLEPDFYEYIGGRHIGALHYWRENPRGRPQPMQQISGGPLPDVTQFFTAGAMCVPGEYSWFVEGRKMGARSPSWLDRMMSDYQGPLIIGSGPEFPLVIDWVRAWGEP